LPPSQCIPRGGSIVDKPKREQRGQCASLFVP